MTETEIINFLARAAKTLNWLVLVRDDGSQITGIMMGNAEFMAPHVLDSDTLYEPKQPLSLVKE